MSTATALGTPRRPAPALRRALPPAPAERHGLGFALFILVNAFLFVRPADVIPALIGVEFYQYSILLCLLVSLPAVLEQLTPEALARRPISLCVLALLPASVLSHLPAGNLMGSLEALVGGLKLLVYYFLFVGLVNTPRRIRIFIGWLAVFAAAVTIVSVLDFRGIIHIPRPLGIDGLERKGDGSRLYGPGLFQDPNDICVLINTALVLLLAHLLDRREGAARVLWLVPVAALVYGFYLTGSRGGLLSLLTGLGAFAVLRLGWARALVLGALGVPLLLALLAGRQTAISAQTDTANLRIFLWSDGLVMFRQSPIFGVGTNNFADRAGQVAHNAYINVLGETGLLGGVPFIGAVALALFGLYRTARPAKPAPVSPAAGGMDPELARLLPCLGGGVAAWAAGMFTLSLQGITPTYAVFGLGTTALALAGPHAPPWARRFDLGLVVKGLFLTLAYVAVMHVFVRLAM
jgi:O-antigen ligase